MRSIICGAVIALSISTPAFATVTPVPEPSLLGLFAAGVAGTVIAYRLRKRK